MKILNLYAGIGGNRKLWKDVDVTAVEINQAIADIYMDFFPNDIMVVGDAHKYLLKHYDEFDFIWSSPPCPSHSHIRKELGVEARKQSKPLYPDMKLYEEILLLKGYSNCKWVVENVVSWYEPLIKPQILDRHYFWSNFIISNKQFKKSQRIKEMITTNKHYDFDISSYKLNHRKDQILRNCVNPILSKHIFDCAFKHKQTTLSKKDVKRICKKLDKLEPIFNKIDEQIDASLKVSKKTLDKEINI